MCLDKITKKNLDRSGQGWKVFTNCQGRIYSDSWYSYTPRKLNCWMRAKKKLVSGWDEDKAYMSGFHIFLKKKDAAEWAIAVRRSVILKVEYRKGHTRGLQSGRFLVKGKIIVAHEMFIIQNKEDK